jgi:hypothetical protein
MENQMKRITAALVGLVFCLGVAACGGGESGEMSKLKDEACACKDMDCYDKVKGKWKDMEEKLEKKYPKKDDAPKDMQEAYKKNRKAMRKCREKIDQAGEGK